MYPRSVLNFAIAAKRTPGDGGVLRAIAPDVFDCGR
jgi:hypothetical protein